MIAVAIVTTLAMLLAVAASAAPGDKGRMVCSTLPEGRWQFRGELGLRMERNIRNWILRAPAANPGILDMFRRRDRYWPYAEHTPWAGEFAGKYLISAVQSCRLSADPDLRTHVARFVRDLISTQDADGYLGPWPRDRRLKGDCDLWGHYHCMLGLLLWADATGDRDALRCVEKAATLICQVYGEGGRRPIQAGNPCFNMSVLHIMAELYRRSGKPEYLALIRRIEEDMPKDGDWLRKGVEGVPYWRLPGSGPRWEALHILEGFVTLWQATGDEKYRKAVLNHWRSIRDLDRHPSGAFSTNEQASGTIFTNGSIETCCSVAWMALSVDVLRLTGDPTVADELELTLWNQALAAQHPSGSWCTYDTPLNGVRAPSYQQISFQYRPGSPELNCCSVNSPRTLGMVPDWAVMQSGDAYCVNFYGPCAIELPLKDHGQLRIVQKTEYPVGATVTVAVEADGRQVDLRFRIPAWSARTSVEVNGKPLGRPVRPGTYLVLKRRWSRGDAVKLTFDFAPRLTMGQGPDRGGQVAIHRGPLLLAFDAGLNAIETKELQPLDVRRVILRRIRPERTKDAPSWDFRPMGLWSVAADGGPEVILCDFASAGARGTDYAAWLPASHAAPAAVRLELPESDARGKPGPILFRWSSTGSAADTYSLVIARDAAFSKPILQRDGLRETHTTVVDDLAEEGDFYWKVVARNAYGATENRDGPRSFTVDKAAPDRFPVVGADGCMAASPLDGSPEPTVGVLTFAEGVSAAVDRHGSPEGAIQFRGSGSGVRYRLPYFPETSYSFTAWVKPSQEQAGMGQIVSAWCRGMDDPLRVTLEGGELTARMEAGGAWRTQGVKLQAGRWYHVAAVKNGAVLRLYVDGKEVGSCTVPERVRTMATEIGLGFNPFFPGGEHFAGCIDDFAFWARALTATEIRSISEMKVGRPAGD